MNNPLKLTNNKQLHLTQLIIQKYLIPIITYTNITKNIINITILTHKNIKTSTNYYLTTLTIFNILYLITNLTLNLKHYKNINKQKIYKYFYLYSHILTNI